MVSKKTFKNKLLMYRFVLGVVLSVCMVGFISFDVRAYNNSVSDFRLSTIQMTCVGGDTITGTVDMCTGIIPLDKWLLLENSYMFKLSFGGVGSIETSSPDVVFNTPGFRYYVNINGVKHYLDRSQACYFTIDNCNTDYFIFGVEVDYIVANNSASIGYAYYHVDFSDFSFEVDSLGVSDVTAQGIGDVILSESEKLQDLQRENNDLQQDENDLQEEANAMQSQEIELQEEANELQEKANETGKSLLDKVTDFFDNFFSRLGDFLLGLIVPSAEELTAFLGEVNDWFGERLGFIWYPFSFAVDMVAALANGTADTGFQVPEFKLNILGTEYQIWGGMTVDLDAFGIFQYVRIFTSFLLVAGIVKLAYDKWDEWIGGHGVG